MGDQPPSPDPLPSNLMTATPPAGVIAVGIRASVKPR
jgi:hypothetical protein